jgi:hypothetical protein
VPQATRSVGVAALEAVDAAWMMTRLRERILQIIVNVTLTCD